MAENNPNAEPSVPEIARLRLILDEVARFWTGMELPSIEVRPEVPRAVPIFTRRADGCYLIKGLQFETAAHAENFANGLAKHLSVCDCDRRQLLFTGVGLPMTQDGRGVN